MYEPTTAGLFATNRLDIGDVVLEGGLRWDFFAPDGDFYVADGYGNQRVGLDLETTINRRDYGINWSMELPSGEPGLADDVTITANLALVQA